MIEKIMPKKLLFLGISFFCLSICMSVLLFDYVLSYFYQYSQNVLKLIYVMLKYSVLKMVFVRQMIYVHKISLDMYLWPMCGLNCQNILRITWNCYMLFSFIKGYFLERVVLIELMVCLQHKNHLDRLQMEKQIIFVYPCTWPIYSISIILSWINYLSWITCLNFNIFWQYLQRQKLTQSDGWTSKWANSLATNFFYAFL